MRRFLAWGSQEPLLCPAEASPPPATFIVPSSAFHAPTSPCANNINPFGITTNNNNFPATILPTNTAAVGTTATAINCKQQFDLLANIERLSAKLTSDSALLFGLPSPPLAATTANSIVPTNNNSCCSAYGGNLQAAITTTTPAAAVAVQQPGAFLSALSDRNNNQNDNGKNVGTTDAANPRPITKPLFVTTTDTLCQQQPSQPQQQQQRPNVITHVGSSASKGLDVFLAALANASPSNGGGGDAAAGAIPQQQQQQTATGTPQQQQQQLANSIQAAVATTALANAVNAVNFMNAAIQQQVQQQQNAAAPPPPITTTTTLPPAALMASCLKSPSSSSSSALLLQPIGHQQQQSQNDNGTLALNSALQLAAARTVIQQQQQQQQFKVGPLSPEQIVQAGLPVLLTRLGTGVGIANNNNILRPPPVPAQSKPIPLVEDKVDLLQFKKKEPREWSNDDVVAWVLDVARRHQIPCENMNLAKFATCKGPLLMLMNEQSFKEHDPNYGALLFSEFCKLVTDENFIDEWMRCSSSSTNTFSSGNNERQQQLLGQQQQHSTAAGPSSSAFSMHNQTPSASAPQPPQLSPQFAANHQQSTSQLLATAAATNNNTTVGHFLAANLASLQQKMGGPSLASAAAALPAEQQPMMPMGGGQFSAVGQQQQAQQQQHHSNLLLAAAATIGKGIPGAALNQLMPSAANNVPQPPSALLNLQQQVQQQQQQQHSSMMAHQAAAASAAAFQHQQQQPIASLSRMMLQQPEASSSSSSSFQSAMSNARRQQHLTACGPGPSSGAVVAAPLRRNAKLADQKIRRNKDGRPRKRSQHTKGNKLWEFIRDALKDPRTCPSIVRWEDPSEGVFRIVESERLAFLWGQKKNNQKMTYEKLSRAMRTYYEKEILVPVPKSGLYPKKLVYKFGPSAMGWKMAASVAVESQLVTTTMAGASMHHHHHRI